MNRIGLEAYQKELHDLRTVMKEIEAEVEAEQVTVVEKAKIEVKHLKAMASRRDIDLKLHKKPEKQAADR